MRIIDTIMSSILGTRAQPTPPPATTAAGMAPPEPTNAPTRTVAPTPPQAKDPEPAPSHAPPAPTRSAATVVAPTPSQAQSSSKPVDVAAVLDARSEETDEALNWRTSIVDLMKLLKLDSSLTARKALAKELKYTGDTNNSAAMNIWLHKQVMAKLVEGGGRLPSDMTH